MGRECMAVDMGLSGPSSGEELDIVVLSGGDLEISGGADVEVPLDGVDSSGGEGATGAEEASSPSAPVLLGISSGEVDELADMMLRSCGRDCDWDCDCCV